jgi:hypothetical protein
MQIEALNLTADPFMREIARKVAAYTSLNDKLVVINGGWGGDLLILSGRQGVAADTPDIVHMNEQGRSLQSLGYNKIVIASESPLLHAAQVTNPGSWQRARTMWRSFATPESADWREIYASDDVVIKELPTTWPTVSDSNDL